MGSYSYLKPNGRFENLTSLLKPHPSKNKPRIFFAGEAFSHVSFQCVNGAYETGVAAANSILKEKAHR